MSQTFAQGSRLRREADGLNLRYQVSVMNQDGSRLIRRLRGVCTARTGLSEGPVPAGPQTHEPADLRPNCDLAAAQRSTRNHKPVASCAWWVPIRSSSTSAP